MQNQLSTIIPSDLNVTIVKGQPMVCSLDVARVFEKEHFHVLRDIRDLVSDGVDDEFYESNFKDPSKSGWTLVTSHSRFDEQGRRRELYYMTEEGFSLLVFGYTGTQAKRFKIAYIREFVRMRNEISRLAVEKAEVYALRRASWEDRFNPRHVVKDPVELPSALFSQAIALHNATDNHESREICSAVAEALFPFLNKYENARAERLEAAARLIEEIPLRYRDPT